MNAEVYYHCWAQNARCNSQFPLILSIATLRANNPTIPITVLWKGPVNYEEWLHFPEKLNFKVSPITFSLEKRHSDKPGWEHLSRIFDLEIHATSEIVIYSDLDVFWFQDVLPLRCDPEKFCFNGNNTGFFYYSRNSDTMQQFFEVFKAFTLGALYDDAIRQQMKKYAYEAWYYVFDEMTCNYMYNEGFNDLFNQLDANEHTCIRDIHLADPDKIKMLHCNGLIANNEIANTQVEHCRGLACLIFKEFYDCVCKVLDQKDLELIFTSQELDYFLPQQFSLLKNYPKLLATKSPDGHYHLHKCLKNNKMFV
jgi:hypothetical protein